MERAPAHAHFLALLGLLAAASACAAESAGSAPRLRMPDPLLSLRDMYPGIASASNEPGARAMQAADTRSTTQVGAPAANRPDLPLTSSWQRLGDARVPGGIRVLTLWHAASSSIALHAGRHGAPSLQWSTPLSAHGHTARGLFDHLLAENGGLAR